MSGNDDGINDQIDSIVFESDVVRGWIQQLRRRGEGIQEKLKKTSQAALLGTKVESVKEMKDALEGLKQAEENLSMFEAAVAKREGR